MSVSPWVGASDLVGEPRTLHLVLGSYAVLLLSLYGGLVSAAWKGVHEGGW
jgi:hypothetical protein